MTGFDLMTAEGLKAACDSIGHANTWQGELREWHRGLVQTLEWFRSATREQRAERSFQERLWEQNRVASPGQGDFPVVKALDDAAFRDWLAAVSFDPLPASCDDRVTFLTALYTQIKERLAPFLEGRVPHLKIFRVMAVMHAETMTTIAGAGHLARLAKAMGAPRGLQSVERHVWVRERLDPELGGGSDLESVAYRMVVPWILLDRFVAESGPPGGTEAERLVPLPAARRRRGLTAIRGLFPAVLSTLEFVRAGVTREELLDFLRATAPESKVSSLGVTINSYQGELDVIRLDQNRYVLTERGENVLESQDSIYLADWLLTHVLGVDRAIVELRDRGLIPVGDLTKAVRASNPGWESNFVPQAILAWLRSMGVIIADAESRYRLTAAGQEWGRRIHWTPESLPAVNEETPPPVPPPPVGVLNLAGLPEIIESVQKRGRFSPALVAKLHAGLWSHERRHFAILTGLSGSGKTLLAREYALALTKHREKGLLTLPVQPGWYDPGALLGYVNPLRSDRYVQPPFLEFLLRASGNPEEAFVAVLDEMNLSHPEQYMAPLLSAMETGEAIELHTEDDFLDGVPRAVPYPSNLIIIGTVNMDETTHGLSDKVLDRAFVLEFWDVDLDAYPGWGTRGLEAAHEQKAREVLVALMNALSPARLHFGWRVVDDVLNFLSRTSSVGATLPFETALDAAVYAKVLPKLRGEDSSRFRDALANCQEALKKASLNESRSKLEVLQRDLETTGSARFWR